MRRPFGERDVDVFAAVILLCAATVGTCISMPAAASAATPPASPRPITQHQSGRADGQTAFVLSGKHQSDAGEYVTTGQLGLGRYDFRMSYDDARCGVSKKMTATGTARLVRSDGSALAGTVRATEDCLGGTLVTRASFAVSLTHGSRDLVGADVVFEGTMVLHVAPDSDVGSESFHLAGVSAVNERVGYWMLGPAGHVSAFGGAGALGSADHIAAAHIEATPTRNGYWIVGTSGRVYPFGDARSLGDARRFPLVAGERVTSISATATGLGYWLFTNRGRVLPFGDAKFFGDLHNVTLNGSVIGSAATPTGAGYYMVGADGGVFTFGDAKFRGSMGASHLNQPVVGIVATASNGGYWLVAEDGGVFTFGDARFRGSLGGMHLNQPVIGLVRYGAGYLMVASDGGVFDFSDRPFFRPLASTARFVPVIGAAAIG